MTKKIGDKDAALQVSVEPAGLPEWLEIVRSKVAGLSYGVVQITVYDKKITQIERTERTRLDPANSEALKRRDVS